MADFDTVTQKVLTLVGGFFDQDLCHVGFVAKSMSQSRNPGKPLEGKSFFHQLTTQNKTCIARLSLGRQACLLRLSHPSIPLSPVS